MTTKQKNVRRTDKLSQCMHQYPVLDNESHTEQAIRIIKGLQEDQEKLLTFIEDLLVDNFEKCSYEVVDIMAQAEKKLSIKKEED